MPFLNNASSKQITTGMGKSNELQQPIQSKKVLGVESVPHTHCYYKEQVHMHLKRNIKLASY